MGLFDKAKNLFGGAERDHSDQSQQTGNQNGAAGAGQGAEPGAVPGAGAGADWSSPEFLAQAQAAQQFASEQFKQAGYGDGSMPTMADMNGGLGAQMAADQQELQAYGQELNRIYQIGDIGSAVITSSTDTGERTAGQAWFQLDVEVSLPGKEPYTVSKREMVPDMALANYGVGSQHEVRVDPADPNAIAITS